MTEAQNFYGVCALRYLRHTSGGATAKLSTNLETSALKVSLVFH